VLELIVVITRESGRTPMVTGSSTGMVNDV
jgi:hypothetical protein